MKYVHFFFIIIFILHGCTTQKPIPSDQGILDSKAKEFKIVFFKNCITYGRRELKYALFKNDLSFSHDFGLGLENYRLLDTLAWMVNLQIDQDSIKGKNKICPECPPSEIQIMMDEAMLGRRTLKYCLDYYTSKELDSIAVIRAKSITW